jgi:hypothetical protein
MKKAKSEEIRSVYNRDDLGPGVRRKYLKSYQKGTNLVLLSPDVAKAFPSEEAVNEALRSLINLAQRSLTSKKRSASSVKTLHPQDTIYKAGICKDEQVNKGSFKEESSKYPK